MPTKSVLKTMGLISSTTGSPEVSFSRVSLVTQKYQDSWLFPFFPLCYSQCIEDVSLCGHEMTAIAQSTMTSHKNTQKQEEKVAFCFVCISLFLLDVKTFPRCPPQTSLGPYWPELDVCPCPSCRGGRKSENADIFSF